MHSFKDSIVLVVGGAGFVGSNLINEILPENPKKIIVVDNLLSSNITNVSMDPRVEFVFGSITENKVLSELSDQIEFVFHLACYHGNQASIADPIADHANNTLTTLKLFERLKDMHSIKKVVYAAAACAVAEKTYDEAGPTTEDQPVSLYHDSPYSISKIIGELYGNYYWERHDLPFVKARFSNVYGPREILGAGRWRGTIHTIWRNVVPTFIWRALNNESLELDNGGNASRDFIFVRDMARGLIACAKAGSSGDTYNLATGTETSILRLAETINELTGSTAPLKPKPAREWDRSGKRFASTEKAKDVLGFQAEVSIDEGLRQTIEWTRQNATLIEACMMQHEKFVR